MRTRKLEHRSQPLLTRTQFAVRLAWTAFKGGLLLGSALLFGVIGYHSIGQLSWIDSLLEASMILGGMGPIAPIRTDAGKLFASFYALFSGIVFLSLSAVLIAPLLHRMLHRLHLEKDAGHKKSSD
jgi:hypothetical protein